MLKFILSFFVLFSASNAELPQDIYKKTLSSIVKVLVKKSQESCSFNDTIVSDEPFETLFGTGFVFHKEGNAAYIATSLHITDEDEEVSSQDICVVLKNNAKFKAEVIGYDRFLDLLVLKIESDTVSSLSWGEASKTHPLQTLYTIGHPLGLDFSALSCTVSAIDRDLDVNESIMSNLNFPDGITKGLLQLDGNLNEGLSGAPVINDKGLVVGMCCSNLGHEERGAKVGFALPSDKIKEVLNALRTGKAITRGSLGITVMDLTQDIAKSKNLKELSGVIITDIIPGSSAERSSLKVGDVILKLNGQIIRNASALRYYVQTFMIETPLPLEILRNDTILTEHVSLQSLDTREENSGALKKDHLKNGEARKTLAHYGLFLKELTKTLASNYGYSSSLKGVLVENVIPSAGKEDLDIDLHSGDVIQAVDSESVSTLAEIASKFKDALEKNKKSVMLLVHRPEDPKRFITFSLN